MESASSLLYYLSLGYYKTRKYKKALTEIVSLLNINQNHTSGQALKQLCITKLTKKRKSSVFARLSRKKFIDTSRLTIRAITSESHLNSESAENNSRKTEPSKSTHDSPEIIPNRTVSTKWKYYVPSNMETYKSKRKISASHSKKTRPLSTLKHRRLSNQNQTLPSKLLNKIIESNEEENNLEIITTQSDGYEEDENFDLFSELEGLDQLMLTLNQESSFIEQRLSKLPNKEINQNYQRTTKQPNFIKIGSKNPPSKPSVSNFTNPEFYDTEKTPPKMSTLPIPKFSPPPLFNATSVPTMSSLPIPPIKKNPKLAPSDVNTLLNSPLKIPPIDKVPPPIPNTFPNIGSAPDISKHNYFKTSPIPNSNHHESNISNESNSNFQQHSEKINTPPKFKPLGFSYLSSSKNMPTPLAQSPLNLAQIPPPLSTKLEISSMYFTSVPPPLTSPKNLSSTKLENHNNLNSKKKSKGPPPPPPKPKKYQV